MDYLAVFLYMPSLVHLLVRRFLSMLNWAQRLDKKYTGVKFGLSWHGGQLCKSYFLPAAMRAIYGHMWPYVAINGPYMAIYGPYMAIYGHIWAIYGPYMAIYGPYMAKCWV